VDLADLVSPRGQRIVSRASAVAARARRRLRQPLAHFVLIGALGWWAVHGASSPVAELDGDPSRTIAVDGPRIAGIAASWRAATGQAPSEARMRQLLDEAIVEEMLVREALRLQLDRTPVVRQRLSDVARFLELADEPGEAEQAARALGLESSDPIVRRYMAEAMTERLRRAQPAIVSSDAQIDARLESEPDRYTPPPRIRVSHVFVAGHGAEAHSRASRLRDRLVASGATRNAADHLGDPFYGGQHFPLWTQAQLAAALGHDTAAAAAILAARTWSRPVASPYGQHLLWIEPSEALATPAGNEIRRRIARDIENERQDAGVVKAIASLRSHYTTLLDPPTRDP
jgi:hypothetical protein